jgi:tetratricopeptide (TPR) repeat protein
MANQSTVPPGTREPSRANGGVKTMLSEALLETWRRVLHRLASTYGLKQFENGGVDGLYFRARESARAGDVATAAQQFADAVSLAPSYTPAMEAHGEALDRMGQSAPARALYDKARQLRSAIRRGAPDRSFVVRNRGPFPAEIAAYSTVLRSVTHGALPYVARGNAFLAEGRANAALLDYQGALTLKPGLPEVIALKAEALVLLGRYREALGNFDSALAARPTDPEILSGRAIAHLALGALDAADDDWRRQLKSLPPERAAARACILLRMADYEAALPELERALEKEPADPYWQLYRLTARQRLGRPAGRSDIGDAAGDAWPGPLLALHAGQLTADEALQRADTEGRRAEALFQLGIVAWPHDRAEATHRWKEVAELAPPTMIERAAVHHELARPGS